MEGSPPQEQWCSWLPCRGHSEREPGELEGTQPTVLMMLVLRLSIQNLIPHTVVELDAAHLRQGVRSSPVMLQLTLAALNFEELFNTDVCMFRKVGQVLTPGVLGIFPGELIRLRPRSSHPSSGRFEDMQFTLENLCGPQL